MEANSASCKGVPDNQAKRGVLLLAVLRRSPFGIADYWFESVTSSGG